MQETVINIFGHALYEPVTVLTNIFISVSCAYFFIKLNSSGIKTNLREYWRFFFFFIGLSAGIGSIAHGFKPYFPDPAFYVVWMLMNASSIPASYYLLKATIEMTDFEGETKRKLNYGALGFAVILAILTVILNNF